MTWRERWIFQTFGRVLVIRWARRIISAAFIAMVVFAVSAVVEQLGYVQDRLMSPVALAWSSGGAFIVASLAAVAGAYATRRRLSR
jgi:anaerobic C4-dicarboxylate transporter